ncbi:MAG TPA: HAMP domain-containing sensor histidine kinase [Chitinophagaceae bacterium]|nr:HAMP domain-containing sensor histidine kinase [Chitinophagaceae bacterium]
MPVRIRITLLFVLFVFIIMSIVCGSVYYISANERVKTIKTRLTNRAITIGRLLTRREIFDPNLIRQFDSLTAVSLREKIIQVYDSNEHEIYRYSDVPGDRINVNKQALDNLREGDDEIYFKSGEKEAIGYRYEYGNTKIFIISAGSDNDGKMNLARLKTILLLGFVVGIISALIIGYIFSQRLLRPIKKIADDVSDISVQNLTRRVSTGNVKDEWHYLADTFNQLLNKLQEGFELQRRFISNASHELSTPMTSISSQLEVILEKERSSAEYQKVIRSVYHDVRHMGKLTQTLLEFARASGNKGGLDINLVRIDEILMRIPSEISKINREYLVILNFNNMPEEEEKLLIFGNEDLLLTAIKNIALNACKYSGNHEATINLITGENNIQIEIEDKGMGIPAEEIESIFQPFYRANKATEGRGFGLGLSMADRIIKLHRGSIKVYSVVNKGTTFTIKIPSAANLQSGTQ